VLPLPLPLPMPVLPKNSDPTRLGKNGVADPDNELELERSSASLEACKRRFVVPRALVCDERAEQTNATLEFGIYDLESVELADVVWWFQPSWLRRR
jgi:hypothetical protein